MNESQLYGGSAEEAGWHEPTDRTSIVIWTVKGNRRRLVWRNEEFLKDKVCAECNTPCLECKHYRLGSQS